jgi:SAM-dependent methyltransferase
MSDLHVAVFSRDLTDGLTYVPHGPDWHRLRAWAEQTDDLHFISAPEFHRLQLEFWLWLRLRSGDFPAARVLDIGVYDRRDWMGPGYRTFGPPDCKSDIIGDLLDPPAELERGVWDVVVCTEVLEHCEDPPLALRNIEALLRPGGKLLATTPFFWPDHRSDDPPYPDYWRFTEQGWRLLLKRWLSVVIAAAAWTPDGERCYQLLRRAEGYGLEEHTRACTGFFVEAVCRS